MKKIILLAEDDPEISSFLKKHISTLLRRCSVIVANDGTSVMDICRRTKPDVVLLNYYLPNAQGGKVSGIGLMLLAFVRQQCPNARVVMLTGEDSVDVAFQAGRLGSFAFVSKPFEIEKFDEILRNALADEGADEVFFESEFDIKSLKVFEKNERDSIVFMLAKTNGNKQETAKRLGIGRQTLYNKIEAYGIEA